MSWSGLSLTLVRRSIFRPRLAFSLVKMAWRFRARRWYTRFPFLPLPDPTYIRWRVFTAYGDHEAVPPAKDVERYARWAGKDR